MEGGGYKEIMPGAQTLAGGLVWFEPELAGRRGEGDRRGGERREDGRGRGADGATGTRCSVFFSHSRIGKWQISPRIWERTKVFPTRPVRPGP